MTLLVDPLLEVAALLHALGLRWAIRRVIGLVQAMTVSPLIRR